MTHSDADIARAVRAVHAKLDEGEPYTTSSYRYHREPWMPTLRTIFNRYDDGWTEALRCAGLEPPEESA